MKHVKYQEVYIDDQRLDFFCFNTFIIIIIIIIIIIYPSWSWATC